MDPTIQQISKNTSNPARIVRNGGPWPASVSSGFTFSSRESPPEGFEFDANAENDLCLICNFTVFFNLIEENKHHIT